MLVKKSGGRPEKPSYSILQGFSSTSLFGKNFNRKNKYLPVIKTEAQIFFCEGDGRMYTVSEKLHSL